VCSESATHWMSVPLFWWSDALKQCPYKGWAEQRPSWEPVLVSSNCWWLNSRQFFSYKVNNGPPIRQSSHQYQEQNWRSHPSIAEPRPRFSTASLNTRTLTLLRQVNLMAHQSMTLKSMFHKRAERQSAQMSKIANDSLTPSGTRCFTAVPIWQQWASKGWTVVRHWMHEQTNEQCCLMTDGYSYLPSR